MPRPKLFTLFHHTDDTKVYDERERTEKRVKALREDAQAFLDENNAIVRQIWIKNAGIGAASSSNQTDDSLMERHQFLSQKIDELTTQIQTLEVELYGSSRIGGNSPYMFAPSHQSR